MTDYKENIKELPLGFQQYFKNLYEEYQRISIISSLYNKQRIFFIHRMKVRKGWKDSFLFLYEICEENSNHQ